MSRKSHLAEEETLPITEGGEGALEGDESKDTRDDNEYIENKNKYDNNSDS